MMAVYVAGPLGEGEVVSQNVDNALDVAHAVREMGAYPWVPHLCVLWHARHPRGYEDWLKYDEFWLRRCDAVYRIPGRSPGADREVALAMQFEMPVFYDRVTLEAWIRGSRSESSRPGADDDVQF